MPIPANGDIERIIRPRNYAQLSDRERTEIDNRAWLITNVLADRAMSDSVLELGRLQDSIIDRMERDLGPLTFARDEAGRIVSATHEVNGRQQEVTGQARVELLRQDELERQVIGRMAAIARRSSNITMETMEQSLYEMVRFTDPDEDRNRRITPEILRAIELEAARNRPRQTGALESLNADGIAQASPAARFPVADVTGEITGSPLPGASNSRGIV
jgi:hypothetical protein